MALVSISEAAKLVRRNRTTLYRDIEKGRLSKTVSPEGETRIDTSELLRVYGRLHSGEEDTAISESAQDRVRIALLEEKNRSLERALALEAELRRVKDQVTAELRARIFDKEQAIKLLESRLLMLEYDRKQHAAEPAPATVTVTPATSTASAVSPAPVPAPPPMTSATPPAPPASPDPVMARREATPAREAVIPRRAAAPQRWWERLLPRKKPRSS